jgi:hypothetical protein
MPRGEFRILLLGVSSDHFQESAGPEKPKNTYGPKSWKLGGLSTARFCEDTGRLRPNFEALPHWELALSELLYPRKAHTQFLGWSF